MRTVVPPQKNPHTYHLRCKNKYCGAVLACEKDELYLNLTDPRETCYVLSCPHCKTETWFADIEKYAVQERTNHHHHL